MHGVFKGLVKHWSLVLISFTLLKLHSTVTYPIQKAQERERGREGERERVREKEELGGSLGASPAVPLSKDNFISFTGKQQLLYTIFIAIGKIFF